MNYVLATSRTWNEVLAKRLEKRTGHTYYLVTKNENLSKEFLDSINPRYIFFPHWSYRIHEDIYKTYDCVIFHMTDLPYGRGGSPLQNLILRGHRETKISAIKCVEEMDAGPIYLKRSLCLEGSASEIFLRAVEIIEEMIVQIVQNDSSPTPQEGEPVYFKRRKPEESNLNENTIASLNDFFDFIRMLDVDSYPRAYIDVHGYKMELSRVQMKENKLVGTFVIVKGK